TLALDLPVGEVIEVDISSPPVAAQEGLADQVLTSADLVKERCRSIHNVSAFRAPADVESVVIASALAVLDNDRGGEVISAAGFLRQGHLAAAGRLANLKVAHIVIRDRLAALAALIVSPGAFQRFYINSVSAHPHFRAIVHPYANKTMPF